MKCTRCAAGLLVVAAAFGLGRFSAPFEAGGVAEARQPDKAKQPDQKAPPGMDPAAIEKMTAAMQPGENHKHLDSLLGEWSGTVKFWLAPGTEPMESTGTVAREWNLGNRFLFEHVTANSDMGPFEGYGALGYNTIEKRYESVWLEDHATYMSMMTGSYDAAKKVFTFEGNILDPMTGKRSKQRHLVDVSSPTRQVMTGYGIGPDGKEFKNFEGVMEKKE